MFTGTPKVNTRTAQNTTDIHLVLEAESVGHVKRSTKLAGCSKQSERLTAASARDAAAGNNADASCSPEVPCSLG